jgi:hypothetical protein
VERARVGIETEHCAKAGAAAVESDAGASAEFDAGEPAGLRLVGRKDKLGWNDFACLAGLGVGISGRFADPVVAVVDGDKMCSLRGGSVGAFFDVEVAQCGLNWIGEIEAEGIE